MNKTKEPQHNENVSTTAVSDPTNVTLEMKTL